MHAMMMQGTLSFNAIAMHAHAPLFIIFLILHICYSLASTVTPVQVDNVTFPATAKAPGSSNSFFLGGAGVRGMEIEGKFVKFTAIGIYLEYDVAIQSLSAKWKGKTPQELNDSVDFFRDIVTGPFDKFMRVTMIMPLTGPQYSQKVSENCVAIWKQNGVYTNSEANAIDQFNSIFKNETFPPGSSILFTVLTNGSLVIGFTKDASIPQNGAGVVENKLLAEAVLESMIGKDGVSPAAKQSLATRLSELFKDEKPAVSDGGHVNKLPYIIFSVLLLFLMLV